MALTIAGGNPLRVTGTTNVNQLIIEPYTIIYIRAVYWFNATTTGDLCTLKDKYGQFIIEMRAESDGGSQQWDICTPYHNIYCDDMDSGTLYIYQ